VFVQAKIFRSTFLRPSKCFNTSRNVHRGATNGRNDGHYHENAGGGPLFLAIARKEIKQGRTKKYMKKLLGRSEMADALKGLDSEKLEWLQCKF